MVTINRKTRYQLNLNSTRIRFDVEKLTPVSETFVYCISNTRELKKSVCLISNKSKLYFKPCFLHYNDKRTDLKTLL